jgi:predicted regulator of Ras-like GTPase activity (Roadblock/LC7/MglB family)
MHAQGGTGRDLAWLLNDLSDRVPDFQKAVILSRDGLVIAASKDLSREEAEHLCALAAAVQSLAKGAGETFGVGDVRQTIIELERALLFVTAAGPVRGQRRRGPCRLRDGHAGEAGRPAPCGEPAVPGRPVRGGVSRA